MKRLLRTVGLVLAGTTWAAPSIAHLDTGHHVELTATGEVPLPGDALYPEGIAVSRSGDLYVGSVAEGHILKLDRQTRNILKFSPPNADLMAVIGVYVSNDDKVVYACSSDPKGLFASRRSEVVAFDVQSGSVKRRAALPEGGLCNDIAELDDGTILVTDSFGGSIFALAPNEDALSVWAQSPEFIGEGFNLNGIVTIGDTVFAVKYNSGELFRFSSSETGVTYQRVELSRPLNGPDGLERIGDSKLLVVEGYTGAVSIVDLTTGEVSTLAQNIDSPSTAAIYQGFVYVVQGQLDHFFGITQEPPNAFALKRVNLP